ncbi:MAG: B12-binding domain-containing radical SAM protein [Magnetococcales bacterium]|nr:B12-binding domain-containing radical SAM protein [Magnetococcales bacterium]
MKVLFVVADLSFGEPLGIMALSAICKRSGHTVHMMALNNHDIVASLDGFQPDIVGYSTMSPDAQFFADNDVKVREWSVCTGKKIVRVMGGAHPTFFPEVMDQLRLDAVCQGEGDWAILRIIEAVASGKSLDGIPNLITPTQRTLIKEVVDDLDSLPFPDRRIFFETDPELIHSGMRSFMTQKGCPFKCTYCFNHLYNNMFKGEGRNLFRRRSVESVLSEIKHVCQEYPEVRFIRFQDDSFVWKRDDPWLVEFAERYSKEIGIPFYCLIRADVITERVAALLAQAGCWSVGMSLEAGNERLRDVVLKREMSDEKVREGFAIARKHGLHITSNTILGIPGTTLDEDFQSVMMARSLKATTNQFTIFAPYPRTELTEYAQSLGVLDKEYNFSELSPYGTSMLNSYTDREKVIQRNLCFLGPLICRAPAFLVPILKRMTYINLPRFYSFFGTIYIAYILSSRIFPGIRPRGVVHLARGVVRAIQFYLVKPSEK